uniref:Uncharacterized protein n=1 Tax=Opuntia streptacantha TaxID=393608 RepID=A0A7C8YCR4_OPUST
MFIDQGISNQVMIIKGSYTLNGSNIVTINCDKLVGLKRRCNQFQDFGYFQEYFSFIATLKPPSCSMLSSSPKIREPEFDSNQNGPTANRTKDTSFDICNYVHHIYFMKISKQVDNTYT